MYFDTIILSLFLHMSCVNYQLVCNTFPKFHSHARDVMECHEIAHIISIKLNICLPCNFQAVWWTDSMYVLYGHVCRLFLLLLVKLMHLTYSEISVSALAECNGPEAAHQCNCFDFRSTLCLLCGKVLQQPGDGCGFLPN